VRLIDQTSLASILDAEAHKPTRDRKRLLYEHLAAATNRDQLLALLRVNLAEAPDMLDFLDRITGQASVTFVPSVPLVPSEHTLDTVIPASAANTPRVTIQSTPLDKPNIFARGRRREKPRTKNQEPNT